MLRGKLEAAGWAASDFVANPFHVAFLTAMGTSLTIGIAVPDQPQAVVISALVTDDGTAFTNEIAALIQEFD